MLLSASWAQSQEKNDDLLLKKFTKTELVQLKKQNPKGYEFEIYALENALDFANKSSEKKNDFPTIKLGEKMNYLSLGLKIEDQNQYFNIEGEDRFLVVKSKWVLTNEMKTK